MKEKFLALVNEIKQTGVVEKIYATSSAEELIKLFNQFTEENQKLIDRISDWDTEYHNQDGRFDSYGYLLEDAIFAEGKVSADIAMEIFICIHYLPISNEDAILDGPYDLSDALALIGNPFTSALAKLTEGTYISAIKAKDIFEIINS